MQSHVPLIVGGQSYGGLVAAHMTVAAAAMFDGVILVAPAIDVKWTPVLRIQAAIGALLAWLIPDAFIIPAVRKEDMSNDAATVQGTIDDACGPSAPRNARLVFFFFFFLLNATRPVQSTPTTRW